MKKILLVVVVIIPLFQSCKLEDESIIEADFPPVISRVSILPSQISVDRIPPVFNPEDLVDTTIIVSVATEDKNGDVEELLFDIISPTGNTLASKILLYDNGTHGDTIADDGVFTSSAKISFKKKEIGIFVVRINVKDANGFNVLSLSSLSVINPLLKRPQISNLILSDTLFIPQGSDSVLTLLTVKVIDPQGLASIKSVLASIFTLEGEPYNSFSLLDDGSTNPIPPYGIPSGDAIAGDSIFSARIAFSKKFVTEFFISVVAKDLDEGSSNTLTKQFSVRNQSNGAPVIFGIEMQDTVAVPIGTDTNFVKVAITADDPEGQDDLFAVYFTSMRPDSSIVGTYKMYDDGGSITQEIFDNYYASSGDDLANDALFTVVLPIAAGTTTNTYRDFIFQARDRGGKVSTTLTKRIYLK